MSWCCLLGSSVRSSPCIRCEDTAVLLSCEDLLEAHSYVVLRDSSSALVFS